MKYYISLVRDLTSSLCTTPNLLPFLVKSNGSICWEQQIKWQGEDKMGEKGQALMLHVLAYWTPKRKQSSG